MLSIVGTLWSDWQSVTASRCFNWASRLYIYWNDKYCQCDEQACCWNTTNICLHLLIDFTICRLDLIQQHSNDLRPEKAKFLRSNRWTDVPIIAATSNARLLHIYILVLVQDSKVQQFHYRPGQTLRVPEGWGSQLSRQSAHESGNVDSPRHRSSLSPRKCFWYSFLLQAN